MDPGSTEPFDASLGEKPTSGEEEKTLRLHPSGKQTRPRTRLCANGSDLQQRTEVAVTRVEVVLS